MVKYLGDNRTSDGAATTKYAEGRTVGYSRN
jgi:hypothetical protein